MNQPTDAETPAIARLAAPYLSVVVTTRNDDHGGDPLQRLQAFVNTFDEQCRRTGLDAEVIVVEWNPPADRPRVSELLRLPSRPSCTYRFLDVPPELHNRLQFGDVLPLFQMIGKNVGIRRARGRFVVATNVDIIFSIELVEYLASRPLQPGRLYRVDRHDIQSNVPVEGPLSEQMAYCASNQLRVHTRWGSYPVDPEGQPATHSEDVVDGQTVRLGTGWHVRESAGPGRVFRWASDVATLRVDADAAPHGAALLHLDVESNPYDTRSQAEIDVVDGDTVLRTLRVAGRGRFAVAIDATGHSGVREIELRVKEPPPDWHARLPIFERREAMHYRVYSATLAADDALEPVRFEYQPDRWQKANPVPELSIARGPRGLAVVSDRRKWSYCVRYGPLRAPRRGLYRFELTCTMLEGRIKAGILSAGDQFWLPSTVRQIDEPGYLCLEVAVDLPADEQCWLVVYNDHPDGHGVSRFVIHRLRGTCDPIETMADPPLVRAMTSFWERRAVAYAWTALRLRKVRDDFGRRSWLNAAADWVGRVIAAIVGKGVRYRIARTSPEYQHLDAALRASDAEVQRLAPLQDLADVHRFLGANRPSNLHVNGCGDFQLMAREHWEELRGYPEFETFSMNIDGLLSYMADAAGIREEMLPMPIYHLEHAVGSGWSPEGEAILRKRIAERGITWIDASTVHVWAAYMRWLGRPMIFNGSDWGMAKAQLPERSPSDPAASSSDYVRHHR